MNSSPDINFASANRTFYQNICRFLRDNGYCDMTSSEWLDTRGMALSGQIVSAVKLLRELSAVEITEWPDAPEHVVTGESLFSDYLRAHRHCNIIRRTLPLKDSKWIIDTLIANENVFGTD